MGSQWKIIDRYWSFTLCSWLPEGRPIKGGFFTHIFAKPGLATLLQLHLLLYSWGNASFRRASHKTIPSSKNHPGHSENDWILVLTMIHIRGFMILQTSGSLMKSDEILAHPPCFGGFRVPWTSRLPERCCIDVCTWIKSFPWPTLFPQLVQQWIRAQGPETPIWEIGRNNKITGPQQIFLGLMFRKMFSRVLVSHVDPYPLRTKGDKQQHDNEIYSIYDMKINGCHCITILLYGSQDPLHKPW